MANPTPSAPTIRLHEPAVDFIDNRLPQYGGAFAVSQAQFDPVSGQYVDATNGHSIIRQPPSPPENNTELQEKYFKEALAEFSRSCDLPKSLKTCRFSIRDKPTWQKVIEEVKSAETEYYSVTGVKKIHSRALRWLGRNAAGAKQITNAIPNGDYTSIISASVGLIVDAAMHMNTLRNVSSEAVQSLPDRFEDVMDSLELFQTDERIRDATVALYIAILAALEEILQFYTRPSMKHSKVLLKGENYCLSMQQKTSQIKIRAQDLIHQSQKRTNRTLLHRTENIEQSSVRVENWMLYLLRSHQENSEWYKDLVQGIPQQMRQVLEGEIERLAFASGRHPSPVPPSYIEQSQLLELLDTFLSSTEAEVSYVLSTCKTQPSSQQSRAFWLMRSPRLQRWLNSQQSDALLIHGNSDPAKLSPVSLLCSMLVRSLKPLEPIVRTALFFCGLHSTPNEALPGASGLLRSFVVQLLRQGKDDDYDTSWLTYNDVTRLQEGDVESLGNLFSSIAAQLPQPKVLFFVIDGINYYETEERKIGTGAVFQRVMELVRKAEVGLIVKFLVTSSSRTRYVKEQFRADDIITVPTTVAREHYELNDKLFHSVTGKSVEQLANGMEFEEGGTSVAKSGDS